MEQMVNSWWRSIVILRKVIHLMSSFASFKRFVVYGCSSVVPSILSGNPSGLKWTRLSESTTWIGFPINSVWSASPRSSRDSGIDLSRDGNWQFHLERFIVVLPKMKTFSPWNCYQRFHLPSLRKRRHQVTPSHLCWLDWEFWFSSLSLLLR